MTNEAARLLHSAYGQPVDVLDVGANPIEGDAPYKSLLAAGLARVTGFEPEEQARAELNAKKSAAETYHPEALGAGGPATLHLFEHSGFTSLYPIDPNKAARVGFGGSTQSRGEIALDTHRLDDLPHVVKPDFLKIDVQGAECQIIDNGRQTLSNAMAIWTEVRLNPIYIGEPTFGELDGILREQGFMFHTFMYLKTIPLGLRSTRRAVRRPHFKHVVDGDAVYIRDPAGKDVSTEQIFALGILATGVFESYELALHCVKLLAARGVLTADDVQKFMAALPAGVLRQPVST